MKALTLNAIGRGSSVEEVDIAAPIGREVLVEVQLWYGIDAFLEARAILES